MARQNVLGILFGLGAGAMWAAEAVLGKMLLSSFTLTQVAASEAFFAAMTTLAYVLARREHVKFERKNAIDLLIVGLVGTVAAPLMYFYGLTQTFAVNATLIAHLQPLFIAVFGFYLLKERLHKHDLAAGAVILSSVVLVTGRTAENLASLRLGNYGDLAVLFATLGWAVVAIPGKRLAGQLSSVAIVGCRFAIASIVFIPVLLCLNQMAIASICQPVLGMLVGLGYVFYYEGLKRLKASQVGLTELSSPFFAALLAWNFLGESTTPMQMIGALLLVAGLCILAREKG